MWYAHLRSVLGTEADRYEIVSVAESGASGPRVVILRDISSGKMYALKYGETRVPIFQQVRNCQTMVSLFGERYIPEIFISGEKVMLMEAISGQTFHEAVIKSLYDLPSLVEAYKKILEKFGEVWKKTAEPFSSTVSLARQPIPRAERVREAVFRRVFDGQNLREIAGNKVVINEIETGYSLDFLLELMTDRYFSPNYTTLCHGDPNMDNIIIDSDMDWWLIDFEWVGRHDWRIPASHFVGWWLSNASFLKEASRIKVGNDTICIKYQIVQSELVSALLAEAWKFMENMGDSFKEKQFEQQIKLQLAILLLGDLRFLEARNRSQYAIPLLGEGLRLLTEIVSLS